MEEERTSGYESWLRGNERSEATCGQYGREAGRFLLWLGSRELTKNEVIAYKETLERRYRPASVNAKIAALNGFLEFLGRPELRVKQLRVQKRPYTPGDRELGKGEYEKLIRQARRERDQRLALLLQTICATGIRVSEVKAVTVEALAAGEAVVRLKGKSRVILLPGNLRKKLLEYAKKRGITTGPIFVTRTGRPLDRSNIWKMMKSICAKAGVRKEKVFPHNLRKLFARTFYSQDRDIAKLADILGHSSINTTRIYLMTTGREHRRRLEALGLVL